MTNFDKGNQQTARRSNNVKQETTRQNKRCQGKAGKDKAMEEMMQQTKKLQCNTRKDKGKPERRMRKKI